MLDPLDHDPNRGGRKQKRLKEARKGLELAVPKRVIVIRGLDGMAYGNERNTGRNEIQKRV